MKTETAVIIGIGSSAVIGTIAYFLSRDKSTEVLAGIRSSNHLPVTEIGPPPGFVAWQTGLKAELIRRGLAITEANARLAVAYGWYPERPPRPQ